MEPNSYISYKVLAITWTQEKAVPKKRNENCHCAQEVGKAAFQNSLPISPCEELPQECPNSLRERFDRRRESLSPWLLLWSLVGNQRCAFSARLAIAVGFSEDFGITERKGSSDAFTGIRNDYGSRT